MTGETGYLAADGFESQLAAELGEDAVAHGRLFIAPGPPRPAAWAINVWHEPRRIEIASIGDGAKALRAIQRNWVLYSAAHHGRAKLIRERLPVVSAKPLAFPAEAPTAPLGSWTLLDENTVLAAPQCSNPFPNGEVRFVEDKEGPPNRAYLKLWEALTLARRRPGPCDLCLDLGASPGGWTWALAQLGAQVIAIDKAPLSAAVARMLGVEERRTSAFALDAAEVGPVDWLFSDIVCYPPRLLQLAERWLAKGAVRNFVFTIKFQGETDHETARRFAAIPGSRVMHLHHNKHELTWLKLSEA